MQSASHLLCREGNDTCMITLILCPSCQLGMIQDTLSLSDFLRRGPSLDFVDPSVSQCMIPILGGGPTSVGQRMSPILEGGPIQNENSGS